MSTAFRIPIAPEITSDALEREMVGNARVERWSLARLEREYILIVLNEMGGHRGRTAEILGIDRRTLYRKLREFGVKGARRPRTEVAARESASRLARPETVGV